MAIEQSKNLTHGDNIVEDLEAKKILKEVLGKNTKRGIFNLFNKSGNAHTSKSKPMQNTDVPKNTKS